MFELFCAQCVRHIKVFQTSQAAWSRHADRHGPAYGVGAHAYVYMFAHASVYAFLCVSFFVCVFASHVPVHMRLLVCALHLQSCVHVSGTVKLPICCLGAYGCASIMIGFMLTNQFQKACLEQPRDHSLQAAPRLPALLPDVQHAVWLSSVQPSAVQPFLCALKSLLPSIAASCCCTSNRTHFCASFCCVLRT